MLGDVVKDWVSGQEFVVTWDGSGRVPLQDYDERYTQQRPDAKDRQTQGATMTLDMRPGSVFFKQEV
jgi:hypothetical protein